MPCHIAWRSRNIGKALAWFLAELEKIEQIQALTAPPQEVPLGCNALK
jgi:hypothetical protein